MKVITITVIEGRFIGIYNGNEITVLRLKTELEKSGVYCIVRNEIQSAQIAGFGISGATINLLVNERDTIKARRIIEHLIED